MGFARGDRIENPPVSVVLYALLQKLPGYTARSLLAEDHRLIEDWLELTRAEAHVQEQQERELEAKTKSVGRR